jgi:formylglycine-generating enzyme required for sulfatase activity
MTCLRQLLLPLVACVAVATSIACVDTAETSSRDDSSQAAGPDAGADPSVDAGVPEGMALVPAGSFTAGCDLCHPERDGEACTTCNPRENRLCGLCDMDEQPVHEVTLSAYLIDLTTVTQEAYFECVRAGACTEPHSNFDPRARAHYPVVSVTWDQADTYCRFRDKRLPTEAEWEKAARGADERHFPWGNETPTCALANTLQCGLGVMPVGSFPDGASPYGVLDMAGNVWEWVADYYRADAYEGRDGAVDPTGPELGYRRVYRGGSSGNWYTLANSSNRASTYSPDYGGSGLGFRCARSL